MKDQPKPILLFILLALFSCSDKQNSSDENVFIQKKENKFLGTWKSVKRDYPHSATLTINNDSTYTFEYGACLSFGYSNGTWEITDSLIILNSNEADSCLYKRRFGINCIAIEPIDSSEQVEIPTTIENCKPSTGVDYVVFDNEHLYFEKDTLTHKNIIDTVCPEFMVRFIKALNRNK